MALILFKYIMHSARLQGEPIGYNVSSTTHIADLEDIRTPSSEQLQRLLATGQRFMQKKHSLSVGFSTR